MGSIILHISDLHVSLDKKIGGEVNNHDSYLDTSPNKDLSLQFIDKFISTIKRDYRDSRIYLLITGDTTNEAEIKEFNFALEFLNRIIGELKIEINNILLVPGDHDLNRRDITNILSIEESCTEEKINTEKYKNFCDFYLKLLKKSFDPNKVIFETLLVDSKILLLGLNSCLSINLTKKSGSIPIEQFEDELKQIDDFKSIKSMVCMHHNFTSAHENKNDGQWDTDNRKLLLTKFLSLGIEFVFTGNEHTSSCKSLFMSQITANDAGCLTSKKWDSTFKVYDVVINEDIILKNKIYSLQKTGGNDSTYEWDVRTNHLFSQPEEFVIFKKNPPLIDSDIIEIPNSEVEEKLEYMEKENEVIEEINTYYNPEFTDVLYDKVKELKIFHSGHFHWSETSRAHNWIDVSKLIEDKDNLNFVKNAIIDVIEKKDLENDIDLIIGLGYEGNIISSKTAIKYNKPYAFLPYSYRHDEHHVFENELNFDNTYKDFKNVLIVTDVVNDGRTIRKLIKKRQNKFFENIEKVYVISLFYTGQSQLNDNILNSNFVKTISGYDMENEHGEVNIITFYTVKSLKVEKCPYGKDFRENCLIVKDNLGCVNLFYDETKYKDRNREVL